MFHHNRITLMLMLTLMALAMITCAPAAFADTIVVDAPVTNQQIVNQCNGEIVDLNGTMHQEMSFNSTPSGTIHFTLNATVKMTGVGETTGVNYAANESIHMETNANSCTQENSNNTKIKLISQGPQTPDMVDRATLHVVVDKNCVPKVEISRHQIQCK